MAEFTPQDLSVALVSLARLGHDPSPGFLTAALAAAHQLLPRCNAQVGRRVWLGIRWIDLSGSNHSSIMTRLPTIIPTTPRQQDLSLLITGLDRWEAQPSKAFLRDFMDRVLQCLDDFTPQVRTRRWNGLMDEWMGGWMGLSGVAVA